MANLKYNYSGEWEDVRRVLRNYPANEILKKINRESIALQESLKVSKIPAARYAEYTIFNLKTKTLEKKETIITTWNLIDLAYYTILATHDNRGNRLIDDCEFYTLVDAVEGLKQKKELEFLETLEDGSYEIFLYLWGFVGEQLKAESPGIMFENAARDLYILFEIAKKADNAFDISSIVQEECGFSWEKIICALFLGWAFFSNQSVLNMEAMPFADNKYLDENEFLDIIRNYTVDYEVVRNSPLYRQVLYTKPYIVTQKKELIGISPYLSLCLYEHSIFWIVRNHYLKQKSQVFTDFFGQCFEEYFEELLEYALNDNEFYRIPEGSTPRADWKLIVDGYRFLIEQKSSLIRLDAKQQETNIDTIKEYSYKTIVKAIEQLRNTEAELGDGQYIKFILLYEDYLKPEIIDQVFMLDSCNIESDNRYWLITIGEMERLLCLCKSQRDIFKKIIEERIKREDTHSNEGRSFAQLLSEFQVKTNSFIKQEKIMYYRDLAQSRAMAVLKGEDIVC